MLQLQEEKSNYFWVKRIIRMIVPKRSMKILIAKIVEPKTGEVEYWSTPNKNRGKPANKRIAANKIENAWGSGINLVKF